METAPIVTGVDRWVWYACTARAGVKRNQFLKSCWVMKFHKRGHEVAKADHKHRWLRTASVCMPSFGKNKKMLEEGKKFMESNK